LAHVRSEAENASQAATRAASDLERAAAHAEDSRQEQTHALREQALRYASVPLDHLLNAFHGLAASNSIPGVLAAIVQGLASEFSRVALFNVQSNRLEGAHQVGFDFKTDISKVVIPLTLDSLLAQAVTSGRIESRTASELADSSRAPFGGSPEAAL